MKEKEKARERERGGGGGDLGVREVKCSIHLVQDVDWSWLEQEERENERQCNQRPTHGVDPLKILKKFDMHP